MISITPFGGETPKLDASLLQNGSAQRALDIKLEEGTLLPIRQPHIVEQLTSSAMTIYLNGDEWLSWPGRRVDLPGASKRLTHCSFSWRRYLLIAAMIPAPSPQQLRPSAGIADNR